MTRIFASSSEPFGLFRDGPFRPLYIDGRGFIKPPKLESPDVDAKVWSFRNEEAARFFQRRLDRPSFGRVFIGPLREIKARIKRERDGGKMPSLSERNLRTRFGPSLPKL